MVMEPMQGILASSKFDLGHSDLFCVPDVTSVFFSSCDSVVGDTLQFIQANRGSFSSCDSVFGDSLEFNQANRGSLGV